MQKAYTYMIFLYFVFVVFIGSFFLLNLTLAVINSEFTKAHKDATSNIKPNDDSLTPIENEESKDQVNEDE